MNFVVFKPKFCGVFDGKKGFYSTQTYLTLLRLWIIILFDTQTFGSVYLSNVNNGFSIKTGYRYPALMAARAKNRKTFKRLLLLNQKMDYEIIIQECFLGDPLPKLLKRFRYVEQNGRQGCK